MEKPSSLPMEKLSKERQNFFGEKYLRRQQIEDLLFADKQTTSRPAYLKLAKEKTTIDQILGNSGLSKRDLAECADNVLKAEREANNATEETKMAA